jgi:pSer/pThr/pTyr-binding forkhead associated (FHA) protein
MDVHPSEASGATVRTQKLPLVAAAHQSDLSESNQSLEDSSNKNETLYLAFEAPIEPDADSVEVTLLGSDLAHETPAASAPAETAELVQIQALEIAANRAQIARQERAQEELQRALRLRDGWLEESRNEIRALKEERKNIAAQLAEARTALQQMSNKVAQQATQIASLEADAAERMGMTAFAEDGPQTRRAQPDEVLPLAKPTKLVPLDDDSTPIVLNRRVMTVGRTRESDICVPSALVSRDHARMLVSEGSVVMFDVGSINGCFIDDQLVRRQVLRDGDVVRFADRRYRYCA